MPIQPTLTPDAELGMHLQMARAYWREDRLNLAFAAIKQALRVGIPAGDWYDFQRTVEAEWGARRIGSLWRIGEHFILEADRRQWGGWWEAIQKTAIAAQQDVEAALGVRWAKPALVTLIPRDDWVAFMHARYGYYSERKEWHKICLPPSAVRPVSVFREALHHEIGHAAVHQIAGDRAPRWLDEGIAVMLEGPANRDEARLLHSTAGKRLPTLEQISGGFESYGVSIGSRESRLFYAAAGDFTRRLAGESGATALRAILTRLRNGERVESAFRAATGKAMSRAERDWREDVQKRT